MQQYLNWALRRKFWRAWAFWIPLVVVIAIALFVWAIMGIDSSNNDWSGMVTIITYGDGQKIQVRESILWVVGFLVWTAIVSFADRPKGDK
jgi:hypothetical protein